MKSLRDLSITGLDTERSHAIGGEMVRVYFRVSSPPPLGWSYIFTTTWNTVVYPLKRPAGVESESIWIDCIPEEVGTYHLERLEIAVAQTNAKYRDGARQQTINASHHAELEAQLRSKLRDLDQTLYPRSGGAAVRRHDFWVACSSQGCGSFFSRARNGSAMPELSRLNGDGRQLAPFLSFLPRIRLNAAHANFVTN